MPREYAPIRLDIWADEDFTELTPQAQHLYFVLLSDPTLSYAGVADWRPARIAARASGWTPADVHSAGVELAAKLFIVIDETTEEVLIRSFVKHDGVLKQPNPSVSMANDYAAISSRQLRAVFICELVRLHEKRPEYKGWSKERVQALLGRPTVDPATFPTGFPRSSVGLTAVDAERPVTLADDVANPSPNPSVDPSPNPSANPSGKGSDNPSAKGSVPEPEPEPTTSNEVVKREPRRKRAAALPDDWTPTRDVIAAMRAECPTVDLQAEHRKFTDYWLSKGERRADWTATWRNWIRRAAENPRNTGRPVSGPAGRPLTPAEVKFAQAEALKENPDLRILAAAGISMPQRADDVEQLDVWSRTAIEAAS